jgi:iron(III) transport system ATP-binding protein
LQQVATPRTLYQQPANPAVARFVGDAHFLPATAQDDKAICVLGTVPLAKPYTGPVQVLIRPENLALQAASPAQAHATITRVSYFGHGQLVECCLQDGQTHLQARLGPGQQFAAGDLVGLHVIQPVMPFPPEQVTE